MGVCFQNRNLRGFRTSRETSLDWTVLRSIPPFRWEQRVMNTEFGEQLLIALRVRQLEARCSPSRAAELPPERGLTAKILFREPAAEKRFPRSMG